MSSGTVVDTNGIEASATASTSSSTGGLSSAATGGTIDRCVLTRFALLVFAACKTLVHRRQRKCST